MGYHAPHRKATEHRLIRNSRRWWRIYWRINKIFISLGLEYGHVKRA